MNKDIFINECKKLGIIINDEIMLKLDKYKDLIIEWNNKFNLTTIIEEEDIYLKHFYDSLYVLCISDFNNKKVCDFGTGAGFPGMIIAIINSSTNVTLIESNNKKVSYLNEVREKLNLDNVNIVCDRAELYGKVNREIFDIVTCRAVSNLKIILELSISLLKVDGLFIPLKSNVEEELKESKNKEKLLGYTLIDKKDYYLPIENSKRTILIYKKVKTTDLKYPRNYNIIKKD